MTPLPRFASWDAFNGHLEEQCRNRQGNVLRGHRESIGERFVRDREALKRPLPAPFDACDKQGTRVNSLSLVRYRTNDYSVPVAYGHQEVWIRGYVHEVVIGCGAGIIARHPRSYDREDMVEEPSRSRPAGAGASPHSGSTPDPSIRSTTWLCWSTRSVPWIRPRR